MSRIVIYVDGLCEPRNPNGVASYGFTVYKNDVKIFEKADVVGEGPGFSNNVAEYSALCEALRFLAENNLQNEEITVKSDSRLLVNQMNGQWSCRGGLYVSKYFEALHLTRNFNKISFVWIPREKNREADALSRTAYESYYTSKNMKQSTTRQVYAAGKVAQKDTCINCRWVRFSGPHIGCYKNGKYHGWLPKRFALNNKCEDWEKR